MMRNKPDWLYIGQSVEYSTAKMKENPVVAFHRAAATTSAIGRTASVPAGYDIHHLCS